MVVERRGGERGAERARCRVGAGGGAFMLNTSTPLQLQSSSILKVTLFCQLPAPHTTRPLVPKKVSNATDAPML